MAGKVVKLSVKHHQSRGHYLATTTTKLTTTANQKHHGDSTARGLLFKILRKKINLFQAGQPKQFCSTRGLLSQNKKYLKQSHGSVSDSFLQRKVIISCGHGKGEVISPIFLKKKSRCVRLVLNFKKLDKNTKKVHVRKKSIWKK